MKSSEQNSNDLVRIGKAEPAAPFLAGSSRIDRKASGDLPGVFIKTFGCQMNVYDSEKIYSLLAGAYRPVQKAEEASLVIVNTCSVREKAEHKLYSLVGSLRPLKKSNPDLLIGVGGCVAQQEGTRILSRSKEVDFVFGTHNLSLVPSLVRQAREGSERQVAVDYREDWEELPLGDAFGGRASVFVSISRGCNKNCTYCIVPRTRGPEVSRPVAEILGECELAASRGSREVILLGQTVNSFGLDLSPKMRFSELLKEISDLPGIDRIRFTSPHPQEIREDFFDLLRDNPKICRHVHMPLQSGSDRILKAMNRNYRQKRYLKIIEGLREVCPDIGITTDIIVGFPGETEEDFEETLNVMREVKFDSSYSFSFSPRPGTKAAELHEELSAEEKKERLWRLQSLQDKLTEERLKSWVGKKVEILVDGYAKNDSHVLQGRSSENILVHLSQEQDEGSLSEVLPGSLVMAEVCGTSKYTLQGRYIAGSAIGGLFPL